MRPALTHPLNAAICLLPSPGSPHPLSQLFFLLLLLKFLFIYFFFAALGLCCCAQAFSSCGEQGLLFVAAHGLLIAVASLVAEHGL